MNDFINKLIDDIHNINPELALERQTEYNRNFVNKILNEQCNIADVSNSVICDDWIHEERVNENDDTYCPICGKQLQGK